MSMDPNNNENGELGSAGVFLNLGEKNSSDDPLTTANAAPVPSKMNIQVLLAGLVFVIGVGAIVGMRQIGMNAGIQESAVIVEYTSETTTSDFIERFDTVMTDLVEASVAVQLSEGSELPEKPFTLETEGAQQPVNPSYNPMNDPAALLAAQKAREEEERIIRIESAAGKLVLQSVLGGTRPVARISGKAVAKGMVLNDMFKVRLIEGSRAIVEADGLVFELTIGGGVERIE